MTKETATSGLVDFRHCASYYYAKIINALFVQPYNHIRFLHEFWGDDLSVDFRPFRKKTVFHDFISYVIDCDIQDDVSEEDLKKFQYSKENEKYMPQKIVEAEPIFLTNVEYYAWHYKYDIEHPWEWASKPISDLTVDDISDYLQELSFGDENYEKIILTVAREVFNILFSNRELLAKFNIMLADRISESKITNIAEDHQKYFKKDGVLLRKRIPEWAKNAVFYRDKGHCVYCRKNISGLITNLSDLHVDHIVPLAMGGLNDLSNLQILCDVCNLKKSKNHASTNNCLIDWYKWDISKET